MSELGKILMGVGAAAFVLGAVLAFSGHIPLLGRLPGDIVIRREHGTFYFPIATSVLLSLALSALFYFFRR
ncbi:MAG: DUF2905 domain-containing protein [Candidatus Methylomirabilis sp.]|nr:DUF2905 domain-containing protein [Deltaproteobacteria bacterium]